jgi:hypothetical protein
MTGIASFARRVVCKHLVTAFVGSLVQYAIVHMAAYNNVHWFLAVSLLPLSAHGGEEWTVHDVGKGGAALPFGPGHVVQLRQLGQTGLQVISCLSEQSTYSD